MKINLDQWQIEFLETQGDKILCTGRQVGKSEICAMDAGEYAVNNPKSEAIIMIAPTERQAYALFEKTLNYLLDNYKNLIKMGKDRPTQTKITLKSGVRIYCLPVGLSGLGIRFITIGRLYADEASRIPPDVWTAITPALLTTGGDSIYLSTPFGKQGEFYNCWINKDGAYNSFKRFSIDSEKVVRERVICETWTEKKREKALEKLEQAKARLTESLYAQEYMGKFMDELKQLFSEELIKTTCILKRRNEITKGVYYLGCDIAGMGGSENTFEILNKISKDKIEQVENKVTKEKFTTETTREIIHLNELYNFKKIGIDDGGVGFGVFSGLMEDPKTKRKTEALNNASRNLDNEEKGRRKRLLKEDMYIETLKFIETGKLKLLDDEDIIYSLRSVQGEYIIKPEHPTEFKIYGDYTHIIEGIIRALWQCSKDKDLKPFVHYY